ncbi:MAG: FAD-dependent oxidoreductase, partial [Pseudomonadota bacterium]
MVGAGVAGAMSALELRRRGAEVTLIDRWEPGHWRAASTDYNRIIRAISGRDEFYTRWVREARLRWLRARVRAGDLPVAAWELRARCGDLAVEA